MEQISLDPNSLVAFVDDTGHEEFAPGHSIYGLGGCATLAGNLDTLIRNPWRHVRRSILGDPDAPLHATDITPTLEREKQALIGRFFEGFAFMRFAVAATEKTHIPDPLTLLSVVAPVLVKRIVEIFQWTAAPSLTVIFESNDRADAKIEQHFSAINLSENGLPLPIEWGFMPKAVGEPALEVADFIMHAVHGLAWDNLAGRNAFSRRDIRAVFQRKNPRLSSFMLIDHVAPNDAQREAVLVD